MALVFDDDRAAVFIQPKGVDPAAMLGPGALLTGEKTHTEESLHSGFDDVL